MKTTMQELRDAKRLGRCALLKYTDGIEPFGRGWRIPPPEVARIMANGLPYRSPSK